jgi:hypothetical protein
MPAAYVLNPRPDLTPTWQLLHTPGAEQGGIGVADLTLTFDDATSDGTFEVIDVSSIQSMAVQVWGDALNLDTGNLTAYGWMRGGPGKHLGPFATGTFGNFTSPATTGWHASASTHPSVKRRSGPLHGPIARGFDPAAAYRGMHGYSLGANDNTVDWLDVTLSMQVQTNYETDFPGDVVVNFGNTRLKYFGLLNRVLAVGKTMGAIFKPLVFRN